MTTKDTITRSEALDLFARMYSERTMRDRYSEIRSLCAGTAEEQHAADMAKRHNAESNAAMLALESAGYVACRDEENDDMPTLYKNRMAIAYWDEYSGVTEVSSYADPAVEAMAEAIATIPGFSKLVWMAAYKLSQARSAVRDRKEYEETHKTRRGAQYAKLSRWEHGAGEAFFASVDSVDCILDAIAPDLEYHATLEEVNEIVKSCSPMELYAHAETC